MGVEIKGLEDIEKRLNGIADAAKMEQALNKACLVVEEAARIKADKGRTGDLARSITTKIEGFTGTIYSPLEYAPYVEYGTGKHARDKNGR